MTATETTIAPPSAYPSADWIEDVQDYFWVSPDLRGHYAADQSAPTRQQKEALHEVNYAGRKTVDQVIADPDSGAHRLADPVDRGDAASRGLLSRWRQPQDEVHPYDAGSMALKVWEHGIRIDHATRSAAATEAIEAMEARRPRCQICGTTTSVHLVVYGVYTRGATFCGPHIEAVNLAGAQRDLAGYRDEVNAWLDTIS